MDQVAFLEELDARQNEVLDKLLELDARVETLIKECLAARESSLADD